MPMKNELAEDIGLTAGKSQYDAQCKRVLANKEILAWILKHTVKEFADMSIRRIKKCIGNDIQISKVRVDPGKTNTPEPERIIGESEEDKVPGEGKSADRDAQCTSFDRNESRAEDPGTGRRISYTHDRKDGKGAESDVQFK